MYVFGVDVRVANLLGVVVFVGDVRLQLPYSRSVGAVGVSRGKCAPVLYVAQMCAGIEFQALDVAVGALNADFQLVDNAVGTHSGIHDEVAELVVHHGIGGMYLSAIVERGMQIVLPLEFLGGAVPVFDVIVSDFAIGGVLVSGFQFSRASILLYICKASVAVPVVFPFVSSCAFVSVSGQVKHVAFRIFQRTPVVTVAALQ